MASPIVSVDDHVVEPPDTFAGRLPRQLADRAPRVVEVEEERLHTMLGDQFAKWDPARNPVVGAAARNGPRQAWLVDDRLYPIYGMDSCAGRPSGEWGMRPLRFDEIRPGSWDVDQRISDMDQAGVYASLSFPSMWVGFCGTTFLSLPDADLGQALMRAWNEWQLLDWCGRHPQRLIPLQLPWLWDVEGAAAEVRANAARGFRALSFSENPTGQGLPSIHSGYWDDLFRACEDTGTVLCLHAGSSGHTLDTSPDAPLEVAQSLFPVGAAMTAVDWVWSRVPVRFPRLQIALSEGGIGWLPVVMDWMDHTTRTHNAWTHGWDGVDELPSEVLLRNFWFCTIDEPRGLQAASTAAGGIEHLMVEVDYPHADSTWPRCSEYLLAAAAPLSSDELARLAWGNACQLFRHPPPIQP